MIDLHTHSSCSDGSDAPGRIIELAVAAGCSAVALTDHDGLSGIDEAREAAATSGITFIPGCEVSCKFSPGAMHILCYFAEAGDGPLQAQLEAAPARPGQPERPARRTPERTRDRTHSSRRWKPSRAGPPSGDHTSRPRS